MSLIQRGLLSSRRRLGYLRPAQYPCKNLTAVTGLLNDACGIFERAIGFPARDFSQWFNVRCVVSRRGALRSEVL
jgi:hypothetical protein